MTYLRENDAAICVNRIHDLKRAVRDLAAHPELISEYAEKANRLGRKNHSRDRIEKQLRQDFHEIAFGKERCF